MVFACIAVVAGGGAVVLSELAPDGTIVMLGPFQSGKVMVVLVAAAVLALGLTVVLPPTMTLLRSRSWWGDLLVVALWIPALPCAGWVLLIAALSYGSEPETHRFAVGGDKYLLASHVGFLGPSDELHLRLYAKDGRLYRPLDTNLAIADTGAFENDGFSLDRRDGAVTLVYIGADGETKRVPLVSHGRAYR